MRVSFSKINKSYDLIIVGAGITGLVFLERLLRKKFKKKILVLDSGSMLSKSPYTGNDNYVSKNLKIKITSRFLGVGGGSNVWGPLHGMLENEKIEHYFNKGQFPLNYFNYKKYINIAHQQCGTPPSYFFEIQKENYKYLKPIKIIKNNNKLNYFSKSSLLESKNVDFVENTEAVKLNFGRVDELHVRFKLNNQLKILKAKKIILSVGTLECIKILTKSFKYKPKNLGKYFMNHPKGIIGIYKSKEKKIDSFLEKKIDHQFSYFKGLKLMNDSNVNPYLRILPGIHFAKIYKYKYYLSDIILTNKNIAVQFFARLTNKILKLIDNIILILTKNNFFSIELFSEISRDPSNCVKTDKDKLIIDYKLSNKEIFKINELIYNFENELQVKTKNRLDSAKIKKLIYRDSAHHMGGLGMGHSKEFLINKKMKLKASGNTYITGGSLFNFSDSINPTLSYIALSIFLADNIYK